MNQEAKICQNCKNNFTIEPEDFAFYAKIKVPPPTWCPECRMIRRMMFRNERVLYKRKCDAPGHDEEIISVYHKDSPFKVYDQKYWWSDEWDPMQYGRDYNFNKPFFEQFRELTLEVPRTNISNLNPVNSDYVNNTTGSKNCYLIFASGAAMPNENCLYGYRLDGCRDCLDSSFVISDENCYEVIDARNCHKVFWSRYVENCIDCQFLYDCKNCSNCFGCVGLRNKQYCIFNKQYHKEIYLEKLKEFALESYENLLKINNNFRELILKYPRKYAVIIKSYNITGDDISNSKNCFDVFYVNNSENSRFIIHSPGGVKNSYDISNSKGELFYENWASLDSYNTYFSSIILSSNDIFFSYFCRSSSNLFGCNSLRNKQYCILNKQYTPERYKELVESIKEHMNEMPYISRKSEILNPKSETNSKSKIQNSQTREIIYRYGEFFPPELSPFAYNETIAQEYFPLTKEQAIEQGYNWKDSEERNIKIDIKSEELPDYIKDVNDDIIDKVIQCQHAVAQVNADEIQTNTENSPHESVSGQHKSACQEQCTTAFKIIKPELEFYRKMNLPLPRLCPNCRHYQRLKQRNPLKLWHRKCQCAGEKSSNGIYQNTIKHFHETEPCPNEFETTYAPERLEIIYCEKCYQAEVV